MCAQGCENRTEDLGAPSCSLQLLNFAAVLGADQPLQHCDGALPFGLMAFLRAAERRIPGQARLPFHLLVAWPAESLALHEATLQSYPAQSMFALHFHFEFHLDLQIPSQIG